MPTDAPDWLADHPPLKPGQLRQINQVFRRRVQAVQSVDTMIASDRGARCAAHGMLHDTYIVFSSDNGLHTGEYRLMPGKLTAFDTDIHVPLVVAGPGVPAGQTNDAMAENVDLAKTFAAIAGTTMPSDGHSLLPLLRGKEPSRLARRDPRRAPRPGHRAEATQTSRHRVSGNPPSYEAIRTPDFLYVEYRDGEREFYDLRTRPVTSSTTSSRTLSPDELAQLHERLLALENCHTGASCWAAGAHQRSSRQHRRDAGEASRASRSTRTSTSARPGSRADRDYACTAAERAARARCRRAPRPPARPGLEGR